MEDLEILEGYHAIVSHAKTGHALRAIITLRAFMGKLKPFLSMVDSLKEVRNCYRITGNENIIMEVVLVDQFHLEKFIDKLQMWSRDPLFKKPRPAYYPKRILNICQRPI